MRTPEFWSRNDRKIGLATALSPLGWAYGAVTDWKRQHASPHRARAKVICVGNLTVGGTGKTPIVRALVGLLKARELRPAILLRGYGGHASGAVPVDLNSHTASDVGDEAMLLAQDADVIVARNRKSGAELADAKGADVIVMDDGYQNFSLVKDLSIVVVDAQTGFGNGRIAPAGPLRESVRTGLARADAVILMGEGAPVLSGYAGPVLRARLIPVGGERFSGRRLVAFAGIGRPAKFFETLHVLGADLVDCAAFEDHHVYSQKEIEELKKTARSRDAVLVTTEKDYARLSFPQRVGISVLPVQAEFDDKEMLSNLLRIMINLDPASL